MLAHLRAISSTPTHSPGFSSPELRTPFTESFSREEASSLAEESMKETANNYMHDTAPEFAAPETTAPAITPPETTAPAITPLEIMTVPRPEALATDNPMNQSFSYMNSVHPRRNAMHPQEVHDEMCDIMKDVYRLYGAGYSEMLYQKAIIRAAYVQGLPVMTERDIFTDFGLGTLLVGRVDLEVAANCLYELKVGPSKIEVDKKQVHKYLKAYDNNSENIQRAALVYFAPGGLFIHNVR